MYLLLADFILITHFLIIAFIVGMCGAVVLGRLLQWQWIYNYQLRMAHLLAIAVVAVQAISGGVCSLTHAEGYLRVIGGQELYTRTFIQHWLEHIVFIDAPLLLLSVVYVLVALAVIYAWLQDRHRFQLRSA